jgi:hypothetical protein
MNTNQIAQIATALNVSPNQIKRAEEWKNVLFVVVQGKGARFVSKKVIIKMDVLTQVESNNFASSYSEVYEWLKSNANPIGWTSSFVVAIDDRKFTVKNVDGRWFSTESKPKTSSDFKGMMKTGEESVL